jgi:hypothetical protein
MKAVWQLSYAVDKHIDTLSCNYHHCGCNPDVGSQLESLSLLVLVYTGCHCAVVEALTQHGIVPTSPPHNNRSWAMFICCGWPFGFIICHITTRCVNSLTPESIPVGTKNSRLEGFWLAKHKNTNIPTMMEPFSPPAAWFWWTSVHHPRERTRKGLDEAVVEGF